MSTKSLASFNPKPVASLTALTTLIFEEPADTNSTSNSVFSAAAPSPPAAPAAATGAAAVTPNSSSIALTKSFNSKTDISLIISIIFSLDMFYSSI